MRRLDEAKILPVDGITETIYKKGNTDNIIEVILHAHKFIKKDTANFAESLEVSSRRGTLRKVYAFVKNNIRYVPDSPGWERVKSPSQTWKDKYGDCKSMSLFVGSLLMNLGFDYVYRFASYEKDKSITHIYCVALLDGREVVMDTVNDGFDKEESYTFKKDHMVKIDYIHGAKKNKQPLLIQRRQNVNFAGTEGDVSLSLLDRELEILQTLVPEKKNIWQRGRNAIHKARKEGRNHSGYIAGIFPKELSHIAAALKSYRHQQMPAISGLAEDLQEYGLNDANLYDGDYHHMYVNAPYRLQYAIDLQKALDEQEGGASTLYEFHPQLNPNYELPQRLFNKMQLQTGLTGGSANITRLKYSNVLQMSKNGMLKSNVRSNDGQLLYPSDQIAYLQKSSLPYVGDFGISAIVSLIITIVSLALTAIGNYLSNKTGTADRQAAYPAILAEGNLTTTGAEKQDFGGWCWDANEGRYRRGEEAFCQGQKGGNEEGSKNNLLIFGAAGAAGLYMFNQ